MTQEAVDSMVVLERHRDQDALERAPRTTSQLLSQLRERYSKATTFDLAPLVPKIEARMLEAAEKGYKFVSVPSALLPAGATMGDLRKVMQAEHPEIEFGRGGVLSFEF